MWCLDERQDDRCHGFACHASGASREGEILQLVDNPKALHQFLFSFGEEQTTQNNTVSYNKSFRYVVAKDAG